MRNALLVVLALLSGCAAPGEEPLSTGAGPIWGTKGAALLRPGVQVTELAPLGIPSERGGCTGAFLFGGLDGAAYMSTAAHCVGAAEEVSVAGGVARARVAYCSFAADGGACAADPTSGPGNDFALLALSPSDAARANASVLHWGGPVGMAVCDELRSGDTLLVYGNSSYKPDAEPAKALTGEVVGRVDEWNIAVRFVPSAIPADSGSPVLTADGLAVGVVRAVQTDGTNHVVCLERAVGWMHEHGGPAVALATAPLG